MNVCCWLSHKGRNRFNCMFGLHLRFCTTVYLCACARPVLLIALFFLMSEYCSRLFLLWKEISLWLAKHCIPACKIQMHSWEVWQLNRMMTLNRKTACVLHFVTTSSLRLSLTFSLWVLYDFFFDQIQQMARRRPTEHNRFRTNWIKTWGNGRICRM